MEEGNEEKVEGRITSVGVGMGFVRQACGAVDGMWEWVDATERTTFARTHAQTIWWITGGIERMR